MTLGTLLLLILTIYLVLVAYGVAGARKKFAGRALLLAEGLLVLTLPVLLVLALHGMGERALLLQWHRLFYLMPLLGLLVAILADRIAAKVGA